MLTCVIVIVTTFLFFRSGRTDNLSIAFSPNRQKTIWIQSKETNSSQIESNDGRAAKNFIYDAAEMLKRGPHCYACAGKECTAPRLKHQHSSLICDFGEVCWTVEIVDFTSGQETRYFRGCGPPDSQKCAGNRRQRPSARSTAGQRLGANGVQYCQWSASVSQCRSCCVADHCNGAQFSKPVISALEGMKNGAASHWMRLPVKYGGNGLHSSERWLAIALFCWTSWFLAFPPDFIF